MSDVEQLREMLDQMSTAFETLADQLEQLMPQVRRTREALSAIVPGAKRMSDLEGSVDAIDAALASELGFDRLEAVRQRILTALADPMDNVPRR